MKFLKNVSWTPINIAKAAGIFLGLVLVLALVIRLAVFSVSPLLQNTKLGSAFSQRVNDSYIEKGLMYGEAAGLGGYDGDMNLSVRNIAPSPIPPMEPGTTGDSAEEYEVKDYSVSIETRTLENDCAAIRDLKSLDYVIFEHSNEYDRGCTYSFKVTTDHVDEILTIIEELDPEDLNENVRTIKGMIDDFTSEEEILTRKLETVTETLEEATTAYEDITALAARNQDAETLAKIIDSKLDVLERLTQERIQISSQLDRLSRAKAEQLDRLEYVYFNVSIWEDKYIDGERLADSWKAAVQNAIRDINKAVQDITIHLLALLFVIIQYVVYGLILVVLAKYGWKVVKYIWNK